MWARGPMVVKGYWNRPEATAETFVDGWVRTGDLAKLDEEGWCYIVDRAKDMIIRGGENIYSSEIENVLYDHPAVTDAALIGLAHPTLGEEPAAVVHLAPGMSATEDELREWVAARLAKFKVPVRVVFDEVPPNLRARPTLSVTLNSSRSGTRDASIRYLTPGLGWTADYVALFDESNGAVDMQGWVTLTNTTGTTFHQADTLLVAGNPNGSSGGPRRDLVRPGTQTADRERLGDFYLYPIDGRTTIANAQTKQVSFLDVQDVPARRVYTIGADWLASDDDFRPASTAISFNSSREGGLGDALPAGTVRFYQRDAEGNPQFIGENGIGHTPMGSTLSLRTGDAFDVYMKAEVENRQRITAAEYEASSRYRVVEDGETVREVQVDRAVTYYRTTLRYTFTNAKPEAVEVELTQSGLGRYWWGWDYRVVSEDVPGEQRNIDNRLYRVSVPANGEREVRVTYETRF